MVIRHPHVGKKVKLLREQTGMSQELLSEKLKMNRASLSQLEKGERKVSADELAALAQLFQVSADTLLDLREPPEVVLEKGRPSPAAKVQERISVPQRNLEKFREVLLYILNKVGAKANVGETVIYKLLYFIDFDFYEKYEEQLVGATYQKNHYGPTPIEFKKIVERMITDGDIERVTSEYFMYPQTKYLAHRSSKIEILGAHELQVIDDVLQRLSDMNATQISTYSHEDVPWKTAKDGATIDYESVFYRTPQYSVRRNGGVQ